MADIECKFVAHHVGSRNIGIGFRVLPAFEADIINVLYDADQDSIAQTKALWQKHYRCETQVYPYCLSDAEKEETFYINFDAYTSSILPFNTRYKDYYTYDKSGKVDYVLGEACRPMVQRQVKAVSLDELLRSTDFSAPPPDFLSLDTQGSEYLILQGARRTLDSHVLGVYIEAEFMPIYKGQRRFTDLQPFLEKLGFQLADLKLHDGYSSYRAPIGARAEGFLFGSDALFLRRWESINDSVPDAGARYVMLRKLAFTAVLFHRLEYALEVLAQADRLTVPTDLRAVLSARTYDTFLQRLQQTVDAMPLRRPPHMAEAMSFEESQARFKA
jgi:FkbM family methyltransferase